MPDDFDKAAARELELRDDAIRNQAARAGIGDYQKWELLSARWCEQDGCGVEIPEARRRALPGVQTCVDCQGELERRGRR
jgi:phage/conjugal plasmid C-4 type zinc finger TraR family protein